MDILFVSLYAMVAATTWVLVYRALYRNHRATFPNLTWDDGDRMFGILWGGLVSVLWFMFIPCVAMWFAGKMLLGCVRPLLSKLER